MDKLEELHITLPEKLNFQTIDVTVDSLMDNLKDSHKKVIFDFCDICFIEPNGVTLLTNLMSWLKSKNVRCLIKYIPFEQNNGKNHEVMKYLRDTNFFEINNFINFYRTPYRRDTMLPINKIQFKDFTQWNDSTFLEYLRRQTNERREFSHLRVAVEEIFNNISNHSTEEIGCCFAQYYPRNSKIKISFSDFGIGIPTSLRNNWDTINKNNAFDKNIDVLDDSELLEIAVKEGVSSKSKPGNRGAGLWNIIRSLTNESIGTVHIKSNYGRIWYNNKKVTNKRESDSYYPGTFFDIILYTDNSALFDDEIEEEFEW